MSEPKIFVINQSDRASAISDLITFGTMTAAYIALHMFAGGAIIGQLIIAFGFFATVTARSNRLVRRMTEAEAREYFGKEAAGERRPGK